MAIRINTNIAALSAQRNLAGNNLQLNKTLERLSSGLRINRAADDAAGLAVSEKLRTQVRGFAQATANAQDATNLVATAESGLEQSSQILQRMRELAIQSASDTLVNADREKIQEEINQLRLELNRIAETTEFNTRPLLDGSIAQATFREPPSAEIKQSMRVGDVNATVPQMGDFFTAINPATAGTAAYFENNQVALISQEIAGVDEFIPTLDVAYEFKLVTYQVGTAPASLAIEVSSSTQGFLYSLDPNNASTFIDGGGFEAVLVNPTTLRMLLPNVRPSATNNEGMTIGFVEINPTLLTASDVGKTALIQITGQREAVTTDNALTFQVGANEGQFLKMGVQDMRAKALRVETLSVLGTNDQDSRLKAQNAIGTIDAALDYVNVNRSRLGAFQNRLEYTVQNLQVSRENLLASDSRIRDADFAAETAKLTRAQILVQAGTSVLTQANVSPQSALNLLRA